MKKSLICCLSLMLVVVSFMASASAAGCSNWVCYELGGTYCHPNVCEKTNPVKTHYQTNKMKRTCVSNTGEVTTEYINHEIKLGCC